MKETVLVEDTGVVPTGATPREVIAFSARLRLPSSVTEEEREAAVDSMLTRLQLQAQADNVIQFDVNRQPSLALLKLVALGAAAVAKPSVLLVDQPVR